MLRCVAVADLHGSADRYEKLFRVMEADRPAAVFLAGDLLAFGAGVRASGGGPAPLLEAFPFERFEALRGEMGSAFPRVFVVLGNDDPRSAEPAFIEASERGIIEYVHNRRVPWGDFDVFGYAYVPPTPFALKDWERYDVSRFVDPGCVSPEEGFRSVPVADHETRFATIKADLDRLTAGADLSNAIMLFHSPPYQTKLDRAALDGQTVEHAPVDCHVGSIAIRRLIEERGPRVTLHGHIHESATLTGSWREQIGRTWCFSAAHDGPELAVISFDPADPAAAERRLV